MPEYIVYDGEGNFLYKLSGAVIVNTAEKKPASDSSESGLSSDEIWDRVGRALVEAYLRGIQDSRDFFRDDAKAPRMNWGVEELTDYFLHYTIAEHLDGEAFDLVALREHLIAELEDLKKKDDPATSSGTVGTTAPSFSSSRSRLPRSLEEYLKATSGD